MGLVVDGATEQELGASNCFLLQPGAQRPAIEVFQNQWKCQDCPLLNPLPPNSHPRHSAPEQREQALRGPGHL